MNYSQKNGKRRKINSPNPDIVLASQIKSINKILKVLEQSNVSRNNYDSTLVPFFSPDEKGNKFVINFESLQNYNIPPSLNRNVILIYKILGDPKKEIYIGEWTLFSLDKALELYKNYCIKGQMNVFDIGYKYEGMGHVTVISCDLKTHLLFYRPDGGSNGYDREINYNNLIKYGSNKFQQFIFSKWFYNILDDNNNNSNNNSK